MTIESTLVHGLHKSNLGSLYKTEQDQNWDSLDPDRIITGPGGRPVAGKARRFFFDTLTKKFSYDTGAAWEENIYIRSSLIDVSDAGHVGISISSHANVPLSVSKGGTAPITSSTDTIAAFIGSTFFDAAISIVNASGGRSRLDFTGQTGSVITGSVMYEHNTNYMSFWANSAEQMRISNTGYLGIGTASPETRLHIKQTTSTWADGLSLERAGADRAGMHLDVTNNAWRFTRSSGGSLVAMSILNNGYVGIGYSAPTTTLVVSKGQTNINANASTVAQFYALSGTTQQSNISVIGGNAASSNYFFGDTNDEKVGAISYRHTGNYMTFHTNGTTERMRITSSGNVGIGQFGPWDNVGLHIRRNVVTDYTPAIASGATNTMIAQILCHNLGVSAAQTFSTIGFRLDEISLHGYIGIIGGVDYGFVIGHSNIEMLRIDMNGGVQIGTHSTAATNATTPRLTVRNRTVGNSDANAFVAERYMIQGNSGTSGTTIAVVGDNTFLQIQPWNTQGGRTIGVNGRGYTNDLLFLGTLTDSVGVYGQAGIKDGGAGSVVTNSYAVHAKVLNRKAGTTIVNGIGVYIDNVETVGTMTNRYDLYCASPTAKSYFSGTVGIGTNTPHGSVKVHIHQGGAQMGILQNPHGLMVQNSANITDQCSIDIVGGTAGYSAVYFSDTFDGKGFIKYNHSTDEVSIFLGDFSFGRTSFSQVRSYFKVGKSNAAEITTIGNSNNLGTGGVMLYGASGSETFPNSAGRITCYGASHATSPGQVIIEAQGNVFGDVLIFSGGLNESIHLDRSAGRVTMSVSSGTIFLQADSSGPRIGGTPIGTGDDLFIQGAQLFRTASSRRYKDDITPLEFDPFKVLGFKTVSFTWNELTGNPGKRDFGFIVEQTDTILNNFSNKNEDGVLESFNYRSLAVAHNDILKSHDQKIKDLEAEIALLKGGN